jgi:hypothetical protein
MTEDLPTEGAAQGSRHLVSGAATHPGNPEKRSNQQRQEVKSVSAERGRARKSDQRQGGTVTQVTGKRPDVIPPVRTAEPNAGDVGRRESVDLIERNESVSTGKAFVPPIWYSGARR